MSNPPPPPGFVLESAPAAGGIPPPPPGFELETEEPPPLDIGTIVGGTPISAAEAEASFGEREGRGLGLGARSVMQGVGGLVGAIGGDAFNAYVMPGDQPSYRDAAGALADRIGLPKPRDSRERVLGDVGEAITGTAATLGIGSGINAATQGVNRFGQFLATQPGLQSLSTATGSAAAGITRESGGTQSQQLAAGLIGGMSPGVVSTAASATTRGAIRGGAKGREAMEGNINAFQAAGVQPTVGQSTRGTLARSVESTLGRLPGSAGVMRNRAEGMADEIGEGVQALAGTLSKRTGAGAAGLSVQRGVRGEGGFIEQRKQVAERLYNEVDQYMPADTSVQLPGTQQALARLTSLTPGAESTSANFVNPKLLQIQAGLGEDLMANALQSGRQGLPYEAVKELRSRVGRMLTQNELITEAPKAELKQLYGALSQDLDAAAREVGPEAQQAVTRANNYWKALRSRTEILESAIEKNGGPEKVFTSLWAGAKDGNTTLRAVMQSLPKDGQRELSAAFVRRLGRATDSAQDDTGQLFSTQTFLTNWNRLSPEAKRTVFDRHGAGFSANMDKVAKVAANLREGSAVFANPSGTAAAGAQIAGLTAFATSVLTGNAAVAGGIAGGAAAANVAAQAMTNPRFVAWLASKTNAPIGSLAAEAAVLRGIGERNDEPELVEVADLLEQSVPNQANRR